MKTLVLFYAVGIFVLGTNAAPYVLYEQEGTTVAYPDHQTNETQSGGPQMRKLNGQSFLDLLDFMDILMDPQSYTNHEV